MLSEIVTQDLTIIFADAVVTGLCDSLGFYHLHPRDRFWDLLVVGGITPKHIITSSERKALADGHRDGSLSDPVRGMFTQKKADQLLKLGIGLTAINRRMTAADEKDKAAKPGAADIGEFIKRIESLNPAIVACIFGIDMFTECFEALHPGMSEALGPKSFKIGNAEVWLLGSSTAALRDAALSAQEDAYFGLGERMKVLKGRSA